MSAPGLRSRGKVPTADAADPLDTVSRVPGPIQRQRADDEDEDAPLRLSLLDVVRMLAGAILLSSILSYFITRESFTWGYRPAFTRPARVRAWLHGPLNLTDAELSLYNGTDPSLPILLGLNGSIYDVTASPHTYGPGGAYHFFAGRDATRAFVTGCFDTDLNGDLRGVEEMFMPVESGEETALSREEKREKKTRRERERRLAHKRVRETVDGWRKMFDGGKDGSYFRRGIINRERASGWKGWGEVKPLCEKARDGRERRNAEQVRKESPNL